MVNTTDAVRRLLKAADASTKKMESELFTRFQAAVLKAPTDAGRQRIVDKAEKRFPDFKEIIASLSMVMAATTKKKEAADRIISMLRDENTGASDFATLGLIDGLTVLTLCTLLDMGAIESARQKMREHGGKKSGKKRSAIASKRGIEVRNTAEKLLLERGSRSSIAGTLSMRFQCTPATIRSYLKKFPPREKRK